METQVPFPKFIQALKDMGADIHGAAFLSDPQAAWGALDAELRAAYLLPMGIQDGPEVKLRIGKRAGGKKSLDDVLVTLTGPEFVAPPRPPEPAFEAVAEDDIVETALVEATPEPIMEAPPSALDPAPAPVPEASPAAEPAQAAVPEKKRGFKGIFGKKPDAAAPPEKFTGAVTDTT